jgi:hypothetical protein
VHPQEVARYGELHARGVFGGLAAVLEQKRAVDFLDVDASILNGFDGMCTTPSSVIQFTSSWSHPRYSLFAGDLRGPVTGADGTRYFEPDGVIFCGGQSGFGQVRARPLPSGLNLQSQQGDSTLGRNEP